MIKVTIYDGDKYTEFSHQEEVDHETLSYRIGDDGRLHIYSTHTYPKGDKVKKVVTYNNSSWLRVVDENRYPNMD